MKYRVLIPFTHSMTMYGPFTNEGLVGEAIKPYRDRVVITTKFGIKLEDGKQVQDNHPARIRQSVEGSLTFRWRISLHNCCPRWDVLER